MKDDQAFHVCKTTDAVGVLLGLTEEHELELDLEVRDKSSELYGEDYEYILSGFSIRNRETDNAVSRKFFKSKNGKRAWYDRVMGIKMLLAEAVRQELGPINIRAI